MWLWAMSDPKYIAWEELSGTRKRCSILLRAYLSRIRHDTWRLGWYEWGMRKLSYPTLGQNKTFPYACMCAWMFSITKFSSLRNVLRHWGRGGWVYALGKFGNPGSVCKGTCVSSDRFCRFKCRLLFRFEVLIERLYRWFRSNLRTCPVRFAAKAAMVLALLHLLLNDEERFSSSITSAAQICGLTSLFREIWRKQMPTKCLPSACQVPILYHI